MNPSAPAALEEAVFRAVVESTFDVVTVLAEDGRIRYANSAVKHALGYTPAELVGRSAFELVHPDDAALALQLMTAALARAESVPSPVRFRNAAGGYRALECSGRPLQGAPAPSLVVTSRDVSGRTGTMAEILSRQKALERRLREQAEALRDAHLEMLGRLARAAECRDDDTGQHIRRVAELAAALAEAIGMTGEEVELIRSAAPLHDVGKIGIRDAILLKPGPLTADEAAVMRTHTTLGARLLQDGRSAVVRTAERIALRHHERWDGRGYPDGLGEEEIPREARVVAVADFFDALTHDRPYRRALSRDAVASALRGESGRAFEPTLTEAFLDMRLPAASR
ncbi:MAG TPA: HD domain-containing phosphohydrolase [Longimicrobiaceae bacterium]|jgi:putative two-component system response regulator|nr:HD domain-containing phosphohydrolase [Longimicrobiaceae bacterium]